MSLAPLFQSRATNYICKLMLTTEERFMQLYDQLLKFRQILMKWKVSDTLAFNNSQEMKQ